MIDEINLENESSISIELEMQGDVTGTAIVRVIIEYNMFNLCFIADKKDAGVYSVAIPKLDNIVQPGEYSCTVEVIIGNKYFTPLKDTVKFKKDFTPVIKIKNKKVEPDNDGVKVKMQKSKEDTKQIIAEEKPEPEKKKATFALL